MATLAEILRQTGYAKDGQLQAPTPTQPNLSTMSADYIRQIPQSINENQVKQMDMLARAFPDDTLKNADPKVMAEMAMQVPVMGSTAIFHGTSPEAAMNIAKRGFNTKKSADGSIWFTTNPEIGEVAATGKGAVIKRLIDENKLKLATPEQADKYFIDQLISEGYKGVKYPKYGTDEANHYQIFDPKVLLKEKVSRKKLLEEQLNKKSVE
jgi:hypothetical protein